MWRGIEISDNAVIELRALYDIANYIKALRDGLIEPGVPDSVDPIIKLECEILLKNLEPYSTFPDFKSESE